MELYEMAQFLKRKWQTVVLFMLVFSTLAFVFSVMQTQKYRSEQRFLVVSTYAEDVDPYAATRSTEYLTNLLSEVMYSQNFLNQVMDSGFALDTSIFPEDAKKRKKAWTKSLRTRVLGDTGILEVSVYHSDQFVTEQLALAIGSVLQTEHAQYHSRGEQTSISVIDQPITSLRPVQPNILLNTSAGFILGILAGLAFIYLFPQREFQFSNDDQPSRATSSNDQPWESTTSTMTPNFITADTFASLYEASEVKRPRLGRSDRVTDEQSEIGYTPARHEPPSNLPIA